MNSIALRALATGCTALMFAAAPAAAQERKPAAAAQPQALPVDPFSLMPAPRPADVASVDAIVKALYEVISGDAGVERDWDRMRSLFYPGARLIPTGKSSKTGKITARVISPEEYIKGNEAFLEGQGFHEREIHRHTDAFGNIVQVFSSYEARHKLSEEKPFLRGINSIQLFNDGKRWWVMTIAWSPETSDAPLPAGYSGKAGG